MSLETNFPKIDQKISASKQHQAAVAYLGQLALSQIALDDLTVQAAALTMQALPIEWVMIWELNADRKSLLLKTNSSGKEGSTQPTEIPLAQNSLQGFTLASPYPITIESLAAETRFQPPVDYLQQGMTCGISVLIGPSEQPYGTFEVFSRQTHIFSQNDLFFVQNVVNVLALFIQKKQGEADRTAERQHSTDAAGNFNHEQYEIKNRLIESRERERLRLAQELHDVPIQDLYGFMYQLDDLRDVVKGTEVEKFIDEYTQILQRVVNSLRTICGELRPPSLSPFGLEVAIRDHVEKFRDQNPDIHVHLELMRDQQEISDSLRLSLFRIYQEAISNVARHSGASDVHIRFRWNANTIILEVEDNGQGFEIPKRWVEFVRKEHFGLLGLAERIESIRGKLEILSTRGQGTLVRAIVPRNFNGL